jgi:acetolactate synthase I/II/III large subunit
MTGNGYPKISGGRAQPQELGDLIIEYLKQIGVEYVFGVPGGAIEPLYNALARSSRRGGPRPVVARHESGAAFMAEGYASETGKLGVCCSTTGPGATNLITGVASAYAENVPMLVITAQTALPLFGKRALQESSCTAVNTVGMFKHCTCFNTFVSHRGQLEGKLIAAITAATRKPSGPAHISIPTDVLSAPRRMREVGKRPEADLQALVRQSAFIDLKALEDLGRELEDAKKVVILVGQDCGDAISEITAFAELFQAAIVSGPQGKRWVDPYYPLYHGVYGFAGHESARRILMDKDVDLILAVGTRLGEMVLCGGHEDVILNEKLVHIDATAEHFSRSPMARLHVYGSLATVFENLNRRFQGKGENGKVPAMEKSTLPAQIILAEPDKCLSDAVPIKPQRLMAELARRFPAKARFLCDAGNSWSWGTHYLHLPGSRRYSVGMGFGAMAWGIGAAVGTAMGCLGNPVVCITGDGSYLMSGQEITVAVKEKLPVVFVILNDQALGMVKHGQRLGGGEPVAFGLSPVDFCQVAQAMGAQAFTIRTPQELVSLDVEAICSRPGPTLLDVHIDPEEVPPMGARIKALRRKEPAVC